MDESQPTNDGFVNEVTPAATTSTDGQHLSKNAQKRQARAARLAEQKKERRAYEREKKREKRKQLAEKRAAGELDEGDEGPRKKAKTDGPRTPFRSRIVVDLGFDDLMSENEIKSLTSQLAFTYSANRKTTQPFESVLFTSLDKRTLTRLDSIGDAAYKRWHDTEWWHESYERLWAKPDEETAANSLAQEQSSDAGDGGKAEHQSRGQSAAQETVVYLTADSEYELSELKEGETYIIGGICDHNRYRNLCLKKSQASGIRSARLPIGTYLAEMRTRKVLTVNQTFEILLKWVETRDWKRALEDVVPKRKFHDRGKGPAEEIKTKPDEQDGEQIVVDAAVLEEEGDDGSGDDDVGGSGEETETLVTSAPDDLSPAQSGNGVLTAMDNTHPELPSS
ncbi:hypothetical protein BDW22DRAFT_1359711 [Trametopsis cervina]|nr:hypothetical protein BDW22DRAFT_1359711 [Trametopsis cervina]